MNRFKIVPGRENDFEEIWKKRDTYLGRVPGFNEFHLVKGKKEETTEKEEAAEFIEKKIQSA